MVTEKPEFEGYNIVYEFPNSNDLLAGMFMNEEAQIILAPTNLGAIIHNKEIDYRLHGVIIWGSLYLVGNEKIESLEDLSGKEIYSTGKGLTTDVLLNYLLKTNGVKDYTIKYASAASELTPLFLTGKSMISLMPEPALSMVMSKKPETEIVMDFVTEWKKATGLDKSYPQAAVFVNEAFRSSNAKFVDAFNEELIKAAAWVNEDMETAGTYYAKIESGLPAEVITASIPRSNIQYILTKDAKQSLIKYYGILLEDDPANIGGKMPDEEFYFEK
jgi:NitT/TauT family transport system substrate-binding protein